jgi:ribosomal protein S18 acetylase RimI-like enzyme
MVREVVRICRREGVRRAMMVDVGAGRGSMSGQLVRAVVEADRQELAGIFGRAGEGSPTASLWGHEASEREVYLGAYMDRVPEYLSVAEMDGALVGYLAGCPDTSLVGSESERLVSAIRKHRLYVKPAPLAFLLRAAADSVAAWARRRPTAGDFVDDRWPAHLHIDLVPEARGRGLGSALMARWQGQLTEMRSAGCHLQTAAENTQAVAFFERCGFRRHGPTPVVPGARFEGGPLHEQVMVWAPRGEMPPDG